MCAKSHYILGLTLVLIFCTGPRSVLAQDYHLYLVKEVQYPFTIFAGDTTGGSDCWGWTASDGTEYALMGVWDGLAVYNATTLQPVTVVPGPKNNDPYYHRDIKTYSHYAYEVSENSGTNQGVMIIDLQYLPDSVHFVKAYINGSDITSHNLSIDTARGFAYILKSNYSGFRVVDLSNPENPVDSPFVPTPDIHDVYARNDTVWVAEGFNGTFSVYDLAVKSAPALLARKTIPNPGYVHNIWPTDDGLYALTTEETPFKTIKVWDLSNLSNITLVGQYIGASNLAHNVQVKGNLVFISHYAAGITVIDISNPANPVEVARYDTYPKSDVANYFGCWGAYPYTQNNYVYASDIEGQLNILELVECFAKPGDVNADGSNPALSDVISLVNYIFSKPGCTPTPDCWIPDSLLCRGDVNASGGLPDLSDVIFLVNYIFGKPGNWTPVPSGVCCIKLQ